MSYGDSGNRVSVKVDANGLCAWTTLKKEKCYN